MNNTNYFVKVRGRTLGPLESSRMRQMIQQGQVSRTNPVSTDGQTWQKAGDFAELFQTRAAEPAAGNGASGNAAGNAAATAPSQGNAGSTSDAARGAGAASAATPAVWYYGVGDSHEGPVTEGVVRELIHSGRLKSDELVWREGMVDWQPLQRLKEFVSLFPATNNLRGTNSRDGANRPSVDFTETKAALGRGSGWAMFVCVLGYVYSALLLLFVIFSFAQGIRVDSVRVIVMSLFVLCIAFAVLSCAIYLNRFLIAGNRFRLTESIVEINAGIRWLNRIWVLVSIFGTIFLVTTISLAVIDFIYSDGGFPPF